MLKMFARKVWKQCALWWMWSMCTNASYIWYVYIWYLMIIYNVAVQMCVWNDLMYVSTIFCSFNDTCILDVDKATLNDAHTRSWKFPYKRRTGPVASHWEGRGRCGVAPYGDIQVYWSFCEWVITVVHWMWTDVLCLSMLCYMTIIVSFIRAFILNYCSRTWKSRISRRISRRTWISRRIS